MAEDRSEAAAATRSDGPDVLIIGAGPTGLTLAAQLRTFGVRLRIIERLLDRAHESRALAVQARSLEVMQSLGLADTLVARGNTSARVVIHLASGTRVDARLDDIGAMDTRFPYILFVSQAETEAVLGEHLAGAGVAVERGVELIGFQAGEDDVACTLRHGDGRLETVRTRYLVGCDGAHSTVRGGAAIPFEGGPYPQDFVLGDVEVDGTLEAGVVNAFGGRQGIALFFPLGRPTTWRLIGIEAERQDETSADTGTSPEPTPTSPAPTTSALSLGELEAVAQAASGQRLRLHDPAWLARFRLHHRQATQYRSGRVILAGDAAHIHSPVGAQGMNTGIQDAWNLGWKLALVTRGAADPALLDTYEAERWPVGRFLLRNTDRLFSGVVAVTRNRLATWLANRVLPRLLPWVMASRARRARLFRFVSQLGIRYRQSPLAVAGEPRLSRGARAGDRLPDAVLARDGQSTTLQRQTAGPHLHLLLCGMPDAWDEQRISALRERYSDLLAIHYLTRVTTPGSLADVRGEAFARLGVDATAQYLVRPDGYIGFRCGGTDLDALEHYIVQWCSVPRHKARSGSLASRSQ